jgi:hypothetical protein
VRRKEPLPLHSLPTPTPPEPVWQALQAQGLQSPSKRENGDEPRLDRLRKGAGKRKYFENPSRISRLGKNYVLILILIMEIIKMFFTAV